MLAKTPPLGWNSWNTFGHHITADVVRETADAFVETGLKDAGYEYIVIDDLWEADEREAGRLTWDTDKFPDGIPRLANYVHSKGLKFGIYSCAGSHTCAGKPASYGYEEVDAMTFAEWGVDFLKYDFCYMPPGVDGPMLYRRMGQALRAAGRPIVFSICEWGTNVPWSGAHPWGATCGELPEISSIHGNRSSRSDFANRRGCMLMPDRAAGMIPTCSLWACMAREMWPEAGVRTQNTGAILPFGACSPLP